MGAVIALAKKDLRLLSRDRMDLFFTFVFPLFIAVLFGLIFAGAGANAGEGGSKIPIALVDEDGTPASAAFAGRLAHAEELSVTRALGNGPPLTRTRAEDL